jgi:DtxR family Mn-dependent transcriptional regulator
METTVMIRPEIALFGFGVVAMAAAALLWPRRGVLARIRAFRGVTERVRIEDALKHLYNCEYAGRACTVESLAGALEVTRDRAVRLLGRLEERGLGRWEGSAVVLTDAGRAYALQVLRSHRLWERYLADRTGLAPGEWHEEADHREHEMTPSEANALAARLGHPLYDPHGDPIPSADGGMPPATGLPLAALAPGEVGRIVHLEDEPREVYDRLVREGLGPRMRIEVLPSAAGVVRLRSGGRERVLTRADAASVSVERVTAEYAPEPGVETLAALEPGESARVVRISGACQGPQRRRLLDLGVVPGTRITAELRSASGDPVAYEIRGALIALRREQAEWIQVRREAPERQA